MEGGIENAAFKKKAAAVASRDKRFDADFASDLLYPSQKNERFGSGPSAFAKESL